MPATITIDGIAVYQEPAMTTTIPAASTEMLINAVDDALSLVDAPEGVHLSARRLEDEDAFVVGIAVEQGHEYDSEDVWGRISAALAPLGVEWDGVNSGPEGGPFVVGGITYAGGEYAWYVAADTYLAVEDVTPNHATVITVSAGEICDEWDDLQESTIVYGPRAKVGERIRLTHYRVVADPGSELF